MIRMLNSDLLCLVFYLKSCNDGFVRLDQIWVGSVLKNDVTKFYIDRFGTNLILSGFGQLISVQFVSFGLVRLLMGFKPNIDEYSKCMRV